MGEGQAGLGNELGLDRVDQQEGQRQRQADDGGSDSSLGMTAFGSVRAWWDQGLVFDLQG